MKVETARFNAELLKLRWGLGLNVPGFPCSRSLHFIRVPCQRASRIDNSRAGLYFHLPPFLKLFFRFICKYLNVEEGICCAD
jgi:hypothetical protein